MTICLALQEAKLERFLNFGERDDIKAFDKPDDKRPTLEAYHWHLIQKAFRLAQNFHIVIILKYMMSSFLKIVQIYLLLLRFKIFECG